MHRAKASELAKNTFTFEEFTTTEEGKAISQRSIYKEKRTVVLHGHCYQRYYHHSSTAVPFGRPPENYHVQIIPLVVVAGSFWLRTEHSMCELVVRVFVSGYPDDEVIIAAPERAAAIR